MMLTKHDKNPAGRDFVVGDIHGQYGLLMEALARVGFDKSADRLFSVGDLIDRGSDSFECLSLAFEPWFYGVRGNHEMLAFDALTEPGARAWDLWQMNGGSWVYLHDAREVRSILRSAMEHLPYAREFRLRGRYIGIVHAEPPPDWAAIEQADEQALVWSRKRITECDTTTIANIDAVVVGHTILEQPETWGNVHYIDTGAFHTGRLTLIEASEVLA